MVFMNCRNNSEFHHGTGGQMFRPRNARQPMCFRVAIRRENPKCVTVVYSSMMKLPALPGGHKRNLAGETGRCTTTCLNFYCDCVPIIYGPPCGQVLSMKMIRIIHVLLTNTEL